ncbi:MAG: Rrf2 family transcriptional regulator [Lachnospiraceae bacterium]|nr:Rrf2 family transcriptional regulator [Lachnospiraceae bacterium]
MKLSTRSKYGLKALIDIAVHSPEGPVPVSDIAVRQGVSEAYLEQLVAKLKKAGMITSQRGAQGGYRLARDAAQISVGDVLRALEGDLDAVVCSGISGECSGSENCVSKTVWKKINDAISTAVDEISLESLAQESAAKSQTVCE